MDFFNYNRRPTVDVHIGNITMGGNHPVVVQTMTNTNTLDTEASVAQCERIIASGAELIRLTAQGVREAKNLQNIREALHEKGYSTPLSADIHFNPRAADAAAEIVEKVRINPGNFVDKQQTVSELEYTDEEYAQELAKIRSKFVPFLNICKTHGTAIRIGVNHGSLSARIMSRYGDTSEGMVESCMEYLRIAVDEEFTNIVISMKSSNTLLMTKAVHLLVEKMDEENIHFPLHLGVTEAGDGDDGRIKSAVGIGALLSDGLGDTIRVSLSEDPEAEIPVAQKMIDYIAERKNHESISGKAFPEFSPVSTSKRETNSVQNIGGDFVLIVISDRSKTDDMSINPHFVPDFIYYGEQFPEEYLPAINSIIDYKNWDKNEREYPLFTIDNLEKIVSCDADIKFVQLSYPQLSKAVISLLKKDSKIVVILTTNHINSVGEQRAFFHKLLNENCSTPVIIQRDYFENEVEDLQIKAGVDMGTLLLDGFGNGIMLSNEGKVNVKEIDSCAFGILQAARVRTSKTEFISCPGCGRTLFDLQTTVAMIKKHFSHLTHLKIGVMGCIVNGPGEMADADYGYVGAERGKISLYKKKVCVEKSIPEAEAVEKLVELMKKNGDWVDPK
ncbi:MAG: 4-hydroxy-3-methylbut-2-en-1-yl diphosphate synthase [Dysgonamonadaceae bacterium]|nr:4-hydroxy-3-methylbut-2-en-1-yl diphosphate synthase [Dysgonamonadaceae bacterium]